MTLKARFCPFCGRANSRLKPVFAAIVLAQIAVLAVYLQHGWNLHAGGLQRVAMSELEESDAAREEPPKAEPTGWVYFQTRDALLGDTTRHARLLSDSNPENAPAAPGGMRAHGSTGVMELRASPRYGNSVVVTASGASYLVPDQQCDVRVKFDDGAIVLFKANATLDGHSTVLVLDDYDGFVAKVAGSHALVMEPVIGQSRHLLHFDVSGLKWS